MTRRSLTATTPAKLRVLIVVLVSLSLAWGVVGGWTVSRHASAARHVVNVGEPLRRDAQQMYASISDADVTATTSFLSGSMPPLTSLAHYQKDITAAAGDLNQLKDAAGDQHFTAALSAFAAGLPVYTAYVAQARSDAALGYPLTGGSFMQVASEEAHLVLLPAAATIYARQDAALVSASGRATGLISLIPILVLAIAIGFVLYRAQRWLTRRFNRLLNIGLVTASAALVIGVLWPAVTFAVARADLVRGVDHGSTPAGVLAQASISCARGTGRRDPQRPDLAHRSRRPSRRIPTTICAARSAPGTGTLLTAAGDPRAARRAAAQVMTAAHDAHSWYPENEQVYRRDQAATYAEEKGLVTATGRGSAASGFNKLEGDLRRATADDLNAFQSSARAGADAFGPLEAAVIILSLVMAGGCAWGLSRRLAEYR